MCVCVVRVSNLSWIFFQTSQDSNYKPPGTVILFFPTREHSAIFLSPTQCDFKTPQSGDSTQSGNTVESQLIKCCQNFPIRSRAPPQPWRHYYAALVERNTLTQHTDSGGLTCNISQTSYPGSSECCTQEGAREASSATFDPATFR